jgi:class 3 adenylate cyclase
MPEQPHEDKPEETPERKPADKTARQADESITQEHIKEAVRIIKTIPFANYNEFLRHANELHKAAVYFHGAGVSGLSTPIRNFAGFQGRQPAGVVTTNYDAAVERKILTHEDEVNHLKSEIVKIKQDSATEFERLQDLNNKLLEKDKLTHLLNAVNTSAQTKLFDNPNFRNPFEIQKPCDAYVIAIDLRRSTELMLKAREPLLFADFIINLAKQLREIILGHYGIFDKFTGDGVLAFFPDFYSGPDFGFRTITAAAECHRVFEQHYREHRKSFITVLKDIGLGIGIDYGTIQMVQIGGAFTVVGSPVVYACRMAGAEANQTYLNYPAYVQIFDQYSAYCDFDECDINIKHEGSTLACRARLNGKSFQPAIPKWDESSSEAML